MMQVFRPLSGSRLSPDARYFSAIQREPKHKNFRSRRNIARFLLTASILGVTVAVVAGVIASRRSTQSVIARSSTITVRAADRGKPFLNLQDGHEMMVDYRGNQQAAAAFQNGTARARALASADLDRNGTPDVVAGYVSNGSGVITVQRGNPDAFAPTDDSVFVRMQQGYNPDSLLPEADVYAVPVSPDFVVTGNFTHDSEKDVLFAAKGGALFLMAGDGAGRLGDSQQINLPGPVTALAVGEFRAADAFTDVAVGVSGPDSLLIFDGAEGFSNALVQYQLAQPANAIEFGGLDDDPFQDVVVAAGVEILVVHGWSRKEAVVAAARLEQFQVGANLRGLTLGEFAWDRKGNSEIAALSDDGTVHIIQNARLDNRPFTEVEALERTRGRLRPSGSRQDVETAPSWQRARANGWAESRTFTASGFTGVSSVSAKPLLRTNLAGREMDDLILMGESQARLEIVHQGGQETAGQTSVASDLVRTTLDVKSTPVAVLTLPRKLNGVTDVIVLEATSSEANIVPNAPNTTITVDRTDDPSGAGLTAASACTAAGNDCSLRGAFQFANLPQNDNTTISLPANTYILSINGTTANGCSDNTTGDLGANRSMSIIGAGAATTIIRQTGTGPANDGDRIMCMNETFLENLIYNFSGVTFSGGRDGAAAGGPQVFGGGGIIGGERGNSLTLSNVIFVNNWTVGPGLGGGAIQITGGNLTITNSTFGGTNAPGLYSDRASVTNANLTGTSGAAVNYTPSSPMHTGGTGILTVTGSTFTRNVANSGSAGGGGADLYTFAFAAPGGIGSGSATFSTSTFTNNQAPTANGGAIVIESLATTVASSSFTNNAAGNRGGGIFVAGGGGSLHLNGTDPSITFSGNSATNGGSSVSTTGIVTLSGTNTTIGGSIEVAAGGSWTNNAGSTLSPTDVVIAGGGLSMNNSTMNVSGNLSIAANETLLFPGSFNGGTRDRKSGREL